MKYELLLDYDEIKLINILMASFTIFFWLVYSISEAVRKYLVDFQ